MYMSSHHLLKHEYVRPKIVVHLPDELALGQVEDKVEDKTEDGRTKVS